MAALSGLAIRNKLTAEKLEERLVVSPILEPNEQLRGDQGSIDVRLGFQFALMAPSLVDSVDEFEGGQPPLLASLYTRQYVPFGRRIVIHPHQFILAATLEYLRLPNNLMAYVIGRSTWGRLGLIVATAVGIQPNFAGTLTLELRNLGEAPLSLYPGQIIAQLFFHEVAGAEQGEGLGQYSGAVELLPKQLSPAGTHQRIRRMKEEIDR
jgi:dCTP deaminase